MACYNYRKGAEFERWIVKQFIKSGHAAIRSAGSRSPIDVIAYNGIDHLAIQAKVRRRNYLEINKDAMHRLIEFSRRLGAKPIIAWKPSHTTKPAVNGYRGNAIFLLPRHFKKANVNYVIKLKKALKKGRTIDQLTKPYWIM